MSKYRAKTTPRQKRHRRVRAAIFGTASRPRLSVFRSTKHVWAQLIDDGRGRTLAAAREAAQSSTTLNNAQQRAKAKKGERAFNVGKTLADKALRLGIKTVVFDRGGYKYQGRVKALAEGAREGGLQF